ncbi:ogr/Delta-like zinc finger family protein [Rodentibacter ratti]|nr:ogr/Delta-like zinc finger family protein [Rodentibacter ratti]
MNFVVLGKMARTTDIYCKVCNAKSVIERTERIHSEFARYYCVCKNPQCGHRFVMNMEFSHTTRSSKLTKENLLKLTLQQLSQEDKDNLMRLLKEESR